MANPYSKLKRPVLEMKNIVKAYPQGKGKKLTILKDINFTINAGEVCALVGPSGCGKTTLLQIAGLLMPPDSGELLVDLENCASMREQERTELRRDGIGFVYQYHHLLPECSALENVMMPKLLAGDSKAEAKEKAKELLGMMKLSTRLEHRPSELSGGEQQRIAIARAMANDPFLIIADEPTGNLDPYTSNLVFKMLLDLARAYNTTALVATHNMDLAKKMFRTIKLENGEIKE